MKMKIRASGSSLTRTGRAPFDVFATMTAQQVKAEMANGLGRSERRAAERRLRKLESKQ